MKHNKKITIILISMFVITQLIGLFVIDFYNQDNKLPYGMDPEIPEEKEVSLDLQFLISLLTSFVIVIIIFFLLTKVKSIIFMRLWFFVVVSIALGIFFNFLISKIFSHHVLTQLIAILIGSFLSYMKIFKRNMIIHNITELLIYPGIACVFIPLLNVWSIILLLIFISFYDIWAVWHSGIMQKMAKYQMDTLKIFSGFFIPYANKKQKQKIKLLKQKYKGKTVPEKEFKKQKIKINVAILGGGDVVFPIISAGVFLIKFGWIDALLITFGATLGLSYLFLFAEKKKFYPAMPYISAGIFFGMILGLFI